MKQPMVAFIALFMIFITPAYSGVTFEDYKKLSPQERQKAALEASPDLQKQYGRWNQILDMGGQSWGSHQAEALIRSKGFTGLENLAITQMNLWGNFHLKMVEANKRAGMKEEDAQKAADAIRDYTAIDKERYKDECWYLVKLAPTPEAMALNEKARALVLKLDKRYGSGNVTREDLKAVDAAVKEIRDQMRRLPQLTPDQIEAGFADLPDEYEHR